jgi:glycosyltransferase involved in cell wall biosynthesis
MIVKNESKVLEECFNSIRHLIDYYVIVDTGSTDNTKEVILNYFNKYKIKGELYSHNFQTCKCHGSEYKKYPYFHFGWNRTYALEKCWGKSEYIFFMDADDVLSGTLNLKRSLTADQYYLQFKTDFNSYNRPNIIRNDKTLGFEFKDGLHEFLHSPAPNLVTHTIVGNYHINSRRLGDRNKDKKQKYDNDCKFLQILMSERPDYPRYKHFYAQSLYDAEEFQNAIKSYTDYIPFETFEEAKYVARLMIGRAHLKILNNPQSKESTTEEAMIKAFEECHKHHPEYAEPYYEIAKYFSAKQQYQRAYDYGKQVAHLDVPNGKILYVDQNVYDYKLLDELVFCASEIKEYEDAIQWSFKILNIGKFPADTKTIITENIQILEHLNRKKQNESATSIVSIMKQHADKTWIGMYLGPSPMKPPYYGSEVAAINLCQALIKQGNKVALFCDNFQDIPDYLKTDIHCFSSSVLTNWATTPKQLYSPPLQFDLMIVSRYVNYFIIAPSKDIAKETFIWVHDVSIHPYYNASHLPNDAFALVRNLQPCIDGYICSSTWHKRTLVTQYELDPCKVHVISLSLQTHICQKYLKASEAEKKLRRPNSFIWVSDYTRGLVPFMDMFHAIHDKYPDATLHIYRNIPESIEKEYKAYPYFHFHGFADNNTILEAMSTTDFFAYLTEWKETFCLSALEAQAMGCICITSALAALETTVGDRGILLYNNNKQALLNAVTHLNENPTKKEEMRKQAQEYALKQDWSAFTTKLWEGCFGKNSTNFNAKNLERKESSDSIDITFNEPE